jgi:hypothetical protein
VDHPCSRREHLGDLCAEAGEVGRQDRGRDATLAENLRGGQRQTAFSMLPWQWLQATIAVLDIRTIVECSPQFGQTETSS